LHIFDYLKSNKRKTELILNFCFWFS